MRLWQAPPVPGSPVIVEIVASWRDNPEAEPVDVDLAIGQARQLAYVLHALITEARDRNGRHRWPDAGPSYGGTS